MSFTSFMKSQQNEDLAPEVYQRMYDQYHLNYLQDFSESFFKASMVEEWFQDRYNPIRIHSLEQATAARASVESAVIKASLEAQPVETVRAMSLDPSAAAAMPDRKRAQSVSTADVVPTSEEMVAVEATETSVAAAPSVPLATRHISGHMGNTLYVSGIHACCTKIALQNAVTAALTASATEANNTAGAVVPDRVVLAQPVWTSSDGIDKFERFAWIVFPTPEAAKIAQRLLSALRVDVYAPLDPDQREPVIAFTFTVHARPHVPKQYYEKNEFSSHHLRVQVDMVRAFELASLLDEERDVPAEQRLAVLLESPAVVEACTKATNKLDVAIAYLRRVHLLAFYGARRFRDESQLLSFSPTVSLRLKEYVPAPLPLEPAAAGTMEAEVDASTADESTSAPSIGTKRKQRDEMEEDGEEAVVAEGETPAPAVVVEGGMEVEGAAPVVKPPAPPAKRFPQVPLNNP